MVLFRSPDYSGHESSGELLLLTDLVQRTYLGGEFEELGERRSQELLVTGIEAFSACHIDKGSHVTGRGDGILPPGTDAFLHPRVVVGERVSHRRNELVAQTVEQHRIGLCNGVEGSGTSLQVVEGQVQWCNGMLHASRRLETVGNGSSEREHLEVAGTVDLLGVNLEVGLRREAERIDAVPDPRQHQTGKLQ